MSIAKENSFCWIRNFLTGEVFMNIQKKLSHLFDTYRLPVSSLCFTNTTSLGTFQHRIKLRVGVSISIRNKAHESHSLR